DTCRAGVLCSNSARIREHIADHSRRGSNRHPTADHDPCAVGQIPSSRAVPHPREEGNLVMQILFLGPPGAGKGTQCKKLAESCKLAHLSSGDLLRDAIAAQTPAGKEAKSYYDKGVLVPDKVLIDMFRERLTDKSCASGFILDGFPRNLAQAEALD